MDRKSINFAEKFTRFSDQWAPKIVAQMNDYQFKLVRFEGQFVWHSHPETDEVFIVLEGSMTINFRDGDVSVDAGEMFVVSKGQEHKTSAQPECKAMVIEAASTPNTGQVIDALTASSDEWI